MSRPPIRDHAFFEHTVLERQVGDALLQRAGLTAQILDLVGGGGTGGVTGKPAFAIRHSRDPPDHGRVPHSMNSFDQT